MKSPPLLLLTAALFFTSSFAETPSSSHQLSVAVPETRLLHIKSFSGDQGGNENINLLTFHKDFVVENGNPPKSYSAKNYYDITSNVEVGTSKTRSIMVTASGLDKNWQLSISSASIHRAFPKPVTLTRAIDNGELVSGVGNIAMRDIELSYKLEPIFKTSESSLPLPNKEISLTFTLTDDA